MPKSSNEEYSRSSAMEVLLLVAMKRQGPSWKLERKRKANQEWPVALVVESLGLLLLWLGLRKPKKRRPKRTSQPKVKPNPSTNGHHQMRTFEKRAVTRFSLTPRAMALSGCVKRKILTTRTWNVRCKRF